FAGRPMSRVLRVAKFTGSVDECASVELWPVTPCLDRMDIGNQRVLARFNAGRDFGLEPGSVTFVPSAERRQYQIVLGREVLVERHLGDARLGQDSIDAGAVKALNREKAQRSIDKPVAARGWAGSHDAASPENSWAGLPKHTDLYSFVKSRQIGMLWRIHGCSSPDL